MLRPQWESSPHFFFERLRPTQRPLNPQLQPRSFGPADTALLLTLAGMWGFSFLFIEVALWGMGPIWIVVGRTGVGALVLFAALVIRGQGLPASVRLWTQVLVLGLLTNAVPWTAVAWAQQTLPSGLVALLMATVPTFTLVVSVAVGLERFTGARIGGLALALAGVGLTVGADTRGMDEIIAIAVVVVATLMYASGGVYANRRVSGHASPMTIAAGQVLASFLATVPAAFLLDPVPNPGDLSLPVLGSVFCLGALGTGGAFLVFYTLIERVGATNTSLVTYLIPLIAVAAGALILGERIGLLALVGGLFIISGVWVAQRGTRAKEPASAGNP